MGAHVNVPEHQVSLERALWGLFMYGVSNLTTLGSFLADG